MLEAILVGCGVVFIILVLVFKVGYVVIQIDVAPMLDVILSLLVIIMIYISLVSGRAPVSLGYSVDVGTKEVAAL